MILTRYYWNKNIWILGSFPEIILVSYCCEKGISQHWYQRPCLQGPIETALSRWCFLRNLLLYSCQRPLFLSLNWLARIWITPIWTYVNAQFFLSLFLIFFFVFLYLEVNEVPDRLVVISLNLPWGGYLHISLTINLFLTLNQDWIKWRHEPNFSLNQVQEPCTGWGMQWNY